jgi:hypothetical protein
MLSTRRRVTTAATAATAAAALLVVPLLTACDALSQLVGHPTPPDSDSGDIVWQVTYGPGFTSLEIALATRPVVTVYGDGRFIVRGPDPNSDPMAVATFEQGTLPPADLQHLAQSIADSHAFDDPEADLGMPGVMDAGSTVVRGLGPDGTPVELDAYALGLGGTDELTDHQKELRADLDSMVDEVNAIVPDEGSSSYPAQQLEVLRLDHPSPTDQPRQSRSWPGAPVAELFTQDPDDDDQIACAAVIGPDVVPVLEAAEANPQHSWRDADGTEFVAVVRIALPGTTPCSD